MTTAETQIAETEVERVERWRAAALEHAGFTRDAALRLAARLDIDVHDAVRLVEHGCPPELAAQILL